MSHKDSLRTTATLLLSAPKIAGLLPAQAESLHINDAPDTSKGSFTYSNARLADVPESQCERLTAGMQALMDVAVAYALDEVNEAALRAAEVLFHRAAGGSIPAHPRSPQAYCAERDAELVDWWSQTARRLDLVRREIVVQIGSK